MAEELIVTKLNIPLMPARFVQRQRLHNLLNENDSWRLLLVSALAGFGKTTLVQSWIEQTKWPTAWVSLDENDNDPTRFLAYFVHALRMVDESIGTAVIKELQSPQHISITDAFIRIINDINGVAYPFILVLDDWHIINEKSLLSGVELLVTNQPSHLHLVIITREEPALPLARLRARGQMVEVRAQELRFNLDEAGIFLNDRMGIGLNPREVVLLEAHTEGWAVGLQLAAISMQREHNKAAFIEAFSGSHRFVLDYLTDEVLTHLTEDVRQFLLKTAILEQLTASLCNAVTGRHDSGALLRQIEEMNLFLVQLDHERQWYRYHHLFAEMLQKQLYQAYPDEVAALHLQASIWYEAQGLMAEAIHHGYAANNIDRLVCLIEKHAIKFIKRGQVHLAKKWIESLPPEIRQTHPRINMDYGWAIFLSNEYDLLPALLDLIEGSATEKVDILGEAAALRAFLSYDNPGQMQAYALYALDIVPDDNTMVRGLVHMGLANVHRSLGEQQKAFEQFAKAIPLHWAAGNRVAAMIALLDLIQVNLTLGQWKCTHRLIEQMFDRIQQSNVLADPAVGLAHIGRGWVLLEQNCPDEAVTTIRCGLEQAEAGGYGTAVYGRFPLTLALILLRKEKEAYQVLTSIIEEMAGLPDNATAQFRVLIAHAYLLLHDVVQAERWIDSRKPLTDAYDQITLARLYIQKALAVKEETAWQQSLSLLNGAIQQIEPHQWNGYLIEALNLRAIIYDALGREESAFANLQQSLALAEPEMMIYDFIREGSVMQALLARLPQTAFSQMLLEGFPIATSGEIEGFGHPSLIESLSEREVAVVRLMVDGLTYNNIAEQLMISINTVRYHVKGLYSKLGVSSRAEAIEKARQLTLLD